MKDINAYLGLEQRNYIRKKLLFNLLVLRSDSEYDDVSALLEGLPC